jgi:hypothetical protein
MDHRKGPRVTTARRETPEKNRDAGHIPARSQRKYSMLPVKRPLKFGNAGQCVRPAQAVQVDVVSRELSDIVQPLVGWQNVDSGRDVRAECAHS